MKIEGNFDYLGSFMNKYLVAVLSLAVLCTPAFAADSSNQTAALNGKGQNQKQCTEMIEECFASSGQERANCFHGAATNSTCEGTSLGKLAYKRWVMSPIKLPGFDSPSAFLGPQVVDQKCLDNFDNQFSSEIVRGDMSETQIAKLDSNIDSCKKEIANDIMRP
jgi:hypothetical protein